jgi:Zn-dependent peptidase ImmA (M78 family)
MDEELKKTKPDLAKARHCATGLFKAAKLTSIPIIINDLVNTAKASFDLTATAVPDKLFNGKGDAVTQRRDDYIFILYNDARSIVRKRFSVAHELGHLYLGHLHGNSSNDFNTDNFDEIEANAFAAHLLMPPTFLRKDIKSGIKDPEVLAKRYNVSVDAMWLQLRNSGLINQL